MDLLWTLFWARWCPSNPCSFLWLYKGKKNQIQYLPSRELHWVLHREKCFVDWKVYAPNKTKPCVCVYRDWRCTEMKWFAHVLLKFSDGRRKFYLSLILSTVMVQTTVCAGSIVRLHRVEGLQESDECLGFFTYKRYFCLWHFAAVKEKVPLAAVWYPDRHPITVAGTISYEDAKNSFYFCNFLWSLQTSSGQ